jgi:DNA-binding transcriptional ArsR family regulator
LGSWKNLRIAALSASLAPGLVPGWHGVAGCASMPGWASLCTVGGQSGCWRFHLPNSTVVRMSDRSDILSLDACGARVVDRERVAAVQDAMPSDEDVEQAADVFALLGDANRLRLLVALLAGGEMCVCDLAASAGMSESATSHAIRWLRAHRIVSSPRRQGRMMYYRLDDAHVRMLLDLALTHSQHTQALHPERDET